MGYPEQSVVSSQRTQYHTASVLIEGPRDYPAIGAGATQKIAYQRALGPHRELHTTGNVHAHPPPHASEVNY